MMKGKPVIQNAEGYLQQQCVDGWSNSFHTYQHVLPQVPLAFLFELFLSVWALVVSLISDLQAGQGQRSQTKELGKTRPDAQNQQHRTVMMNGTYDVQVGTGQELHIQSFKICVCASFWYLISSLNYVIYEQEGKERRKNSQEVYSVCQHNH